MDIRQMLTSTRYVFYELTLFHIGGVSIIVNHIFVAMIAALMLLATAVSAAGANQGSDRVRTANGSVLYGRIIQLQATVLRLETEFAGTLDIAQSAIVSIESAAAVRTVLRSGDVVHGRLVQAQDNAGVAVVSEFGQLVFALADVVAITAASATVSEPAAAAAPTVAATGAIAPAPAEPPRDNWTVRLEGSLDGKSGNSSRLSSGGGVAATRTGENDRLQLFARGERTRDGGELSSEKFRGGLDYEYDVSQRHSWYSRVLLEQDKIAELDLRATAAVGYGRYFLNRDDHKLRARLGLLLRHEAYANTANDQDIGIDLSLSQQLLFGQKLRLNNSLTYTPAIDQFRDYRVAHESSLEIPLAGSDKWRLRLGVSNDFNNMAPAGTKKLDTSYFARIVLDLL